MGFKLDCRGDPRRRNPTPVLVRSESCFRICRTVWSFQWGVSSILFMQSFQCKSSFFFPLGFDWRSSSQFGILFPGEVLDRRSSSYRSPDSLSPKESVWALYCRCMLLWNFCNRFRDPSQEEERAEQAHEAFLEAQAIEDCLNAHRCNLDTTLIYNCREYIHKYVTFVIVLLAFHSPDRKSDRAASVCLLPRPFEGKFRDIIYSTYIDSVWIAVFMV